MGRPSLTYCGKISRAAWPPVATPNSYKVPVFLKMFIVSFIAFVSLMCYSAGRKVKG